MASTLLTFAQGEPGGGGNPGGGSQFTINVVPVEGTDEFTRIMPGPNPGGTHTELWSRDWVTGAWKINGVSTMMSPSIPVGHGVSTAAPIEMTSEGTQKVVVQFTGQLPTNITQVGVILESTASAYFDNSGLAYADNGIGDESFDVSAGSDYNLVGLPGEYSHGRHLRIVNINSAGYGELEFSSSATANSSGYGAQVWASAQAAGAMRDERDISLFTPFFPGPFFQAGPKQSGTITWEVNYGPIVSGGPDVIVTRTFARIFSNPEPVPQLQTAIFSRHIKAIVGVGRTESEQSQYNPAHTKQNISLVGSSTFSLLADFNRHGTYNWTIEDRTWNLQIPPTPPSSGELPITVSATKSDSSTIHIPHNCLVETWEPWGPHTLEFDHSHEGIIGNTHNHLYQVEWADGIKGEAALDIEYHASGESQTPTAVQNFQPSPQQNMPSVPYYLMFPVGGTNQFYHQWISGNVTNTSFWMFETPVLLKWAVSNRPVAKLGTELAKSVPSSGPIGTAVKTTAAMLDFIIDGTAKNDTRSVPRGTKILSVNSGNYGGGTPILELWQSQPGLFMYRMYYAPVLWGSNVSTDNYGLNGFINSSDALDSQMESADIAEHWIEISFALNGVPAE